MFCTGDQSPTNVIIRLAGWSWRRRRHIRTTTPEVAGPPENSIYSSYTSDMTKLALARDHPDPSEGATGPWPTYTMLPELLAAPATSRRLLFPETTTVQCPRPSSRNDILCNAVVNCDSIWRFDNMMPASRCRLMAATIACSLPNWSTQNVGEQSRSRADSGALMNSRNRGWWICKPYAGFSSENGNPPESENWYGQPGSPVSNNRPSPKSMGGAAGRGPGRRQRGGPWS